MTEEEERGIYASIEFLSTEEAESLVRCGHPARPRETAFVMDGTYFASNAPELAYRNAVGAPA